MPARGSVNLRWTSSSVTSRTILWWIDLSLHPQGGGKPGLICSRFPFHRGDLRRRTQAGIRIPVAGEAPSHAQRRHLLYNNHARDHSMARRAAHTRSQVGTVIEIGIIREQVNSGPDDRKVRTPTLTDRHQPAALWKEEFVTVHAGLRRRQVGMRRGLNGMMTVAAVHPQVACMQGVTVRDRLLGTVAGIGITRGTVEGKEAYRTGQRQQYQGCQGKGEFVRPSLEKLSQERPSSQDLRWKGLRFPNLQDRSGERKGI